jgi:hypothetical protein
MYADGDPINGIDPRGREDLVEYVAWTAHNAFEGTLYSKLMGECLSNTFAQIADLLDATISNTPTDLTGEGVELELAEGAAKAGYDLAAGFLLSFDFSFYGVRIHSFVPYPGPGGDCQ